MRFAPSLSGSSPMFQASWVNDSSVLCCPPSVCCACLSFSGGAPARTDVGNEVSEINSRTAEIFSKHFCWLCFLTLFAAAWWWRAFVAVVRVHLVCVSRAVPRFECSYLTFDFFKKKVCSRSFKVLIFNSCHLSDSGSKQIVTMERQEGHVQLRSVLFLHVYLFSLLRLLFCSSATDVVFHFTADSFLVKVFLSCFVWSFNSSLGNGDVIKSQNAHFL